MWDLQCTVIGLGYAHIDRAAVVNDFFINQKGYFSLNFYNIMKTEWRACCRKQTEVEWP